MGNLLGAPITTKTTESDTITSTTTATPIEFAVSSMQGWRVSMEDAHIAEKNLYAAVDATKLPLPDHALFAVFDGHGGSFAAEYAGRNFCRVLSRQQKFVEYAQLVLKKEKPKKSKETSEQLLQEALRDAFLETDKEIASALGGDKVPDADTPYHPPPVVVKDIVPSPTDETSSSRPNDKDTGGDSGTTACVVLLTPDVILCANAGDSRAVLSRQKGTAVPLSYDHKPDDDEEINRVRAAGGFVAGGRVEGDLAVSRGLGDFRFKELAVVLSATTSGSDNPPQQVPKMKPGEQKISPIPDCIVEKRNAAHDEFFVVACDGIWDVMTNEELVAAVGELFQEGEPNVGMICEEICDVALFKGSKDNMTVLTVKLPGQKLGKGAKGGVVAARRESRSAEQKEAGKETTV